MPSGSTDPAADANATNTGTGLQGTNASTHDAETAQRIALLEHFIAFSISSGITSLGVLLEILHLADYDLSRATRIAELVKQSPPEAPALITQSGDARLYNTDTGTNAKSTSDNSADRFWNSVGSVQATAADNTCSAAAASQYSVAVVGCGPNSAGVAVGTSAGTTTSTAVPLSAVTSLPSNTNLTVTSNTGAQVGLKATPNSGPVTTDQNAISNETQNQNQILQQHPNIQNNSAPIQQASSGVSNGTPAGVSNPSMPKGTAASAQQPTVVPTAATPPQMARTRVASDQQYTPSHLSPNGSVLPPTASSIPRRQVPVQSQVQANGNNGHAENATRNGDVPPVTEPTGTATIDMGGASDPGMNGGSKLPPGVSPEMKLEDLFQYLKA